MKANKKPVASRPKRSGFNERADTFTLSRAKAYLDRLTEKAVRGEAVYIIHGRHRFALQPVPVIEPIPARPVGYFQLDEEDLALDDRFASAKRFEVLLDESEGLDWKTAVRCHKIILVNKAQLKVSRGRVSQARRREIGRRLVEVFRIPL